MDTTAASAPTTLAGLAGTLRRAPAFTPVAAALAKGRSATVDGAWGSSAAVVAGALCAEAPSTLVVVIGHPRDLDGWAGDLESFADCDVAVFPAWDRLPGEEDVIDEVASRRLRLLRSLESSKPHRVVLTTFQALIQPVPDRAAQAAGRLTLHPGKMYDLDALTKTFVEQGYENAEAVESTGTFARRGGILDVWPPDAELPYRLEFFGDEVESVRHFDPQTQRTKDVTDRAEIMPLGRLATDEDARRAVDATGHFCDYLPESSWVALVEMEDLVEQGKLYHERITDSTGLYDADGVFRKLLRFPSVKISALPSPTVEAACSLRVESVERLSGDVKRIRDELDSVVGRDRVLIACENAAEVKRLTDVLAAGKLAASERLKLVEGRVKVGFRLIDAGGNVVVLGGQELFQRDDVRQVMPRRKLETRAIDSFLDLNENDVVVHVSHGIARYRGMQMLEKDSGAGGRGKRSEEHLVLEFKDGVKLYVPSSKIDLVQKYVGGNKLDPPLSKLGGTAWQSKKEKVQAAVMDLASDMIQLQAEREAKLGEALAPDTDWQKEFEGAFPYQETPDQLTALVDIKAD